MAVAGDAQEQPPSRDGRAAAGQPDPPPWLAVIVTTLRLFVQRRVLRIADRPAGGRTAGRWALTVLLPVVPVLVVAAVAVTAVIILTRHPAATNPAAGGRPDAASRHPAASQHPAGGHQLAAPAPASAAVLRAAAENRTLAAAWITAQVSPGVVVACDPLMCQALLSDDFPAGDMEQLGTGAADPLGAGVVVSTATVRSEFGPRLVSVYAPAVLASFGSGPETVAVLATAPDGAAAYMAAASADQLARQQAGAQLLHNANIRVPAAAQAELADGQVDSRLLITLAALAHILPVDVLGFGDAGPGASAELPLRSMTISGAEPLAHGGSYPDAVLAFLRAQQPPFPTTATVAGTGAATVLQITVTAPSPLGLLSAQPPDQP